MHQQRQTTRSTNDTAANKCNLMYSIVDRKDYSKSPANVCYSQELCPCLNSRVDLPFSFSPTRLKTCVFTRRLANYKSSDDEDILMMMYQIYSYKYI